MAYNEVCGNNNDFQCVDKIWENQLEMFKIAFDAKSLIIKYIDDENEQVGLNTQQDYDFALEMAREKNGYLNLIFIDGSGKVMSKNKFHVITEPFKLKSCETVDSLVSIDSSISSNIDENEYKEKDERLINLLEKFKHDILNEMDTKIKHIVNHSKQSLLLRKSKENIDESQKELELYEINENMKLENKANKLLKMLGEARYEERPGKKAYIEEELKFFGGFQAEFVIDVNMPDGTLCSPNRKFQKQWLIKNIGKLSWKDEKFPIELVCIAGNIPTLHEERVKIPGTECDTSVQVSVNLVSPSLPGEYYTEWALVCKGFQFGPKLWCAIEVKENISFDEKIIYESSFSEDEEFVVVPDCLDLTKKWRPDYTSNMSNQEILNGIENCYLESASQVEKKFNSMAMGSENSESKNDSSIQEVDDNAISNNMKVVKDSKRIPKNIQINTNFSATPSSSIQSMITNHPFQSKTSHPTLSAENVSGFEIIKNSLANLQGPSNIGDSKIDFTQIQNPLTESPTNRIQSSLNFNNSFAQIANAIGSLGSLYQSSERSNDKMSILINMGFANRNLNKKLLNKYDNDIDKVLQDLLERSDNNWHEHR